MRQLTSTAFALAVLAIPGLLMASPGLRPGRISPPPGPAQPAQPKLESDSGLRRAVRGCPIDFDCHTRLSADLLEFETRNFAASKDGPWLDRGARGRTPVPRGRASDPGAVRPDLPWLKNIELPDIPVVWDERLIAYLEFYKNDPRGRRIIGSWLKAQGRYEGMILGELRKAGLPRDLLYVAMIESSFDATEYSRTGASGLWQFMPGSGKIYGLRISRWLDERNDPVLATRAAALYFKDLYQRFGNWHLALAAYNGGYGAVIKSMAKYNTNDFWSLADYENGLPWEATLYVPKVLATAIVSHNRRLFGFADLKPDAPVTFDNVEVSKPVPLGAIAKAAGTSRAAIEALNPQLRRGRTPPGMDQYILRVPRNHAPRFAERFSQLRGDWDDVDSYLVRHGERFEDIATRFGISRSRLAKLNGIRTEAEIHGGTVLVVPKTSPAALRSGQKSADDNLYASGVEGGEPGEGLVVAVPRKKFSYPGRRRMFYRVVSGDSQYEIAQAFGVDRFKLAQWNGLDPEAHLTARMVLQVWPPKGVDLRSRGIKLLDPKRILLVQSGSKEHLDATESRIGRKRRIYRATRRESFETIGKKFGLSKYDLARINRMSASTVLESKQECLVYEVVDPKASDRAAQQAKLARRKQPRRAKRARPTKRAPERSTKPKPKPKPKAERPAKAQPVPKTPSPPDGPKADL